jgi:quercetin dioxygenase-like cupin family protein
MRRVTVVLVLMAGLLVAPVAGQESAQVTSIDAERVAAVFAAGGRLAAGSDFSASVLRRTRGGDSEVHQKETDIFYVVDGAATFVTGGTLTGGKETAANQLRGSGIDNGQVHNLKKGDFIVIPAGVPHWFKEVPESINYLTIKILKP